MEMHISGKIWMADDNYSIRQSHMIIFLEALFLTVVSASASSQISLKPFTGPTAKGHLRYN